MTRREREREVERVTSTEKIGVLSAIVPVLLAVTKMLKYCLVCC